MSLSLRARLTLSYAALVGAALALVAVLLARLVFETLAHPVLAATETSVRIAESIAATQPRAGGREIQGLIAMAAERDGVVVRLPPPHRGVAGGFDGPPARGIESFNLLALLGARAHFVRVRNDAVMIAPSQQRLRPALTAAGRVLATGLLFALVFAWLVARWLTGQAMRPLLTVTAELRRFAGGDFTPRLVRTGDREELGALIAAYNGAAANVSAAFEERRRVEEHMRRFVADAGHELRTPLTVIDGYLQILRRDSSDAAVRERALATLQSQSARMRALVERLMVLARLERPDSAESEEVEVATVAADAIAAVISARGGGVALDARATPTIRGSAGDLHEAIRNLVENALKYGAGSAVRVTVDAHDGEAVVAVRDGGPGIPAAERERIFERFYRGEERGEVEGSGLGLAIVERAAARCGGAVALECGEPGRTAFVLRLPTARRPAEPAVPLVV